MNALAYKDECDNPWGIDKPQRRRREGLFRPVIVELTTGDTEQSRSVADKVANKYGFVPNHLQACEWSNIWAKSKNKLAFYGGGEATPLENTYCYLEHPAPIADWIPYYHISAQSPQEMLLINSLETDSISEALNSAKKEDSKLRQDFNELANVWYRETGMISMLHKKVMHPAYQRIIGMGKDALPLIFNELNEKRGHWLWALCSITGEDPAAGAHRFSEAVNAWLEWGKENGYI